MNRQSFAVTKCDAGKVCTVIVFGRMYTIYENEPEDVKVFEIIDEDIKGVPSE